MRLLTILSGIYPGFDGLVRFGQWGYLALSLFYALILDAVILAHYYWIDWIPAESKKYLWILPVFAWFFFSFVAWQKNRYLENKRRLDQAGNLFLEATTHYLKGNWDEATHCANILLRYNQGDIEALLLLVTIHRHTRRLDRAGEILDKLERLEAASRWYFEIALERGAIAKLRALVPETIPQEETVAEIPESSDDGFREVLPYPSGEPELPARWNYSA